MLPVLIHTLGCKLNQLESEAFADAFRQAGFVLYDPLNETAPSIVVINTCTVTSKADQKARRVIRKSLRDYPDSVIIVTGCYAQLEKSKISGLDSSGRLFVLEGMEKESILSLPRFFRGKDSLSGMLKTWQENNKGTGAETAGAFQFLPEKFSEHTRSFLKIQDGCDKHCAYCRIRLARGPSVSLASAPALERLRILEETHAEAVLTGVNISQYRDAKLSNGGGLGELLEYLLCGTAKISLRLSSLAPENITASFAKILSDKRIRPHFHLSVQSGSNRILEKMGRNYNADTIKNAAALLRRAKGDPFLACDIITGFPGETEAEFTETLELCRETGFAWIHVFPYSKRPGTPAYSFSGAVHESEISRRVRLFTDLARRLRADYIRRWFGREVEALTENGFCTQTACRGVSENYLKLLIRYKGEKSPPAGTVLRCRLFDDRSQNKDYDAAAEEI